MHSTFIIQVAPVFSCLALLSCLLPFLTHPLYAGIYSASLASLPSAFLLFTGGLILLAACLLLLVRHLNTGDPVCQDPPTD